MSPRMTAMPTKTEAPAGLCEVLGGFAVDASKENKKGTYQNHGPLAGFHIWVAANHNFCIWKVHTKIECC